MLKRAKMELLRILNALPRDAVSDNDLHIAYLLERDNYLQEVSDDIK